MKHRDGTAERRQEVYRDALVVIARDFARDLQIDDVARDVASSRRQLQRVFAEVGETSFRELLAVARMTEARKLLADGQIRIQDVAAKVGYHQSAQFSKSFRRQFGISPREYRKRRVGSPVTAMPAAEASPMGPRSVPLARGLIAAVPER